jgi:transketolase
MPEVASSYGQLLREAGERYPELLVIDAGLATSMQTELFQREFPTRYINLGIAEQNAVGVASGLARQGFIPLLHSFANFLSRRARDQIAVSVAWPGCNVKFIAGSCGAFDGRNGPSHQAIDDLAGVSLPGMFICEPADLRQVRALLFRAIEHPGPAYVRLWRHGIPLSLTSEGQADAGTALIETCDESSCTLVAAGSLLAEGIQAARMIVDQGLSVDLVHVSVLQPLLSEPLLISALRTQHVISFENHGAVGGFGDAISRVLGPLGIHHDRFAFPNEFLPAGDPQWQLAYCGLDATSIAAKVRSCLGRPASVEVRSAPVSSAV